jgi:LAGLIDADG endonuclease
MVDEAFLNWLAGFIDGEGSFGIYPSGRAMATRFTLSLRDDDAAILQEIVQRTGIGHLVRRRRIGSSRPQTKWIVYGAEDQVKLVEILDAHPLRAKKLRDYEVWRRAVIVRASHARYGDKKPVLVALAAELVEARIYA